MTAEATRAWLDALRADPDPPVVGLSPAGLDLVLGDALDALAPVSLDAALALPGQPWDTAVFVAARTVVTAPLEWLALLLGRGTAVTLKHPRAAPGLVPWLAHHATRQGLPLAVTADRDLPDASLVIAMGSDRAMEALRPGRAEAVHRFGDRFSVAWWPAGTPRSHATSLARTLAAHDSRGCLTPSMILTDDDPETLHEALADAMDQASRTWPRGACAPAELARLRARNALARVVGRATVGEDWAVHTLPSSHAAVAALPRAAQIVATTDPRPILTHPSLSTVGTPDGHLPWDLRDDQRVTTLDTMQAPPLWRRHDGVDVVRATLRPTPEPP